MLCRLGGRWLRPLPVLQLGEQGPQFVRVPTGGAKRTAVPVWAVASVSAVSPSGAGGWYEALATSAPVQGAEELLLGAHSVSGLPWWSTVLLTTVALRSVVTLPLAAYQHYILAKVRGLDPRVDPVRQLKIPRLLPECLLLINRDHLVAKKVNQRSMCEIRDVY